MQLKELGQIKWFTNCGSPLNGHIPFSVEYVHSWAEAQENYSRPEWDDTTLEARNRLMEFLDEKYPSQADQWNPLTEEAKSMILPMLDPILHAVKAKHGLDQRFIDCVRWDILAAVMEETYRFPRSPRFFTDLLKVYQAGNFPCGWRGNWPDGKLVIY